jgi:hypothetical protein
MKLLFVICFVQRFVGVRRHGSFPLKPGGKVFAMIGQINFLRRSYAHFRVSIGLRSVVRSIVDDRRCLSGLGRNS